MIAEFRQTYKKPSGAIERFAVRCSGCGYVHGGNPLLKQCGRYDKTVSPEESRNCAGYVPK